MLIILIYQQIALLYFLIIINQLFILLINYVHRLNQILSFIKHHHKLLLQHLISYYMEFTLIYLIFQLLHREQMQKYCLILKIDFLWLQLNQI